MCFMGLCSLIETFLFRGEWESSIEVETINLKHIIIYKDLNRLINVNFLTIAHPFLWYFM